MKTLKLIYWKWRLKIAYLNYLYDEADYGKVLGDHISGRQSRVNVLIDKVNTLDPEARLKYV